MHSFLNLKQLLFIGNTKKWTLMSIYSDLLPSSKNQKKLDQHIGELDKNILVGPIKSTNERKSADLHKYPVAPQPLTEISATRQFSSIDVTHQRNFCRCLFMTENYSQPFWPKILQKVFEV